jgi:hypothetical protein
MALGDSEEFKLVSALVLLQCSGMNVLFPFMPPYFSRGVSLNDPTTP